MRQFVIKKAERRAAPVLAAFMGISGSGKTFSALKFARGLVGNEGKIVVIDTEGGRAEMYSGMPDIGTYDHIDFRPPYSPEAFVQVINMCVNEGYHAIIIDSASHEYEGEGGVLSMADAEEARLANHKGRDRAKWVKPKMAHSRFMSCVRGCPAHLILCIRQKSIIDTDSKPAREILEPVCERSFMFDMMLTIELKNQGHANFIKVPEPFLPYIKQGEQIKVDHGKLLMQEAARGDKINHEVEIKITNLETVAREYGVDELKKTWETMYKTLSDAEKKEIMADMPRIKAIAQLHKKDIDESQEHEYQEIA